MDEEVLTKNFIGRMLKAKENSFQFFARLTPTWITPNIVTSIRAIFIIPIYWAYRQDAIIWVIILFVIALLTDTFDGILARYQKKESDVGKLLDPAADKILFIGLFLLVGPERLSQAIIYTIVILELTLVLLAVVVGPLFARFFRIKRKLGSNIAGKIKMTLEGTAVIILLFGLNTHAIILISEVLLWIAAFFALASIILHFLIKEKGQNTPQN